MKRLDYLILSGLVFSFVVFITLSLQNVSNQNTQIATNQELLNEAVTIIRNNSDTQIVNQQNIKENQRIIQEGAIASKNNTDLILENQQVIINLSNTTQEIIDRINVVQQQLDTHVLDINNRNFSRS